jgi:hypothetical protein
MIPTKTVTITADDPIDRLNRGDDDTKPTTTTLPKKLNSSSFTTPEQHDLDDIRSPPLIPRGRMDDILPSYNIASRATIMPIDGGGIKGFTTPVTPNNNSSCTPTKPSLFAAFSLMEPKTTKAVADNGVAVVSDTESVADDITAASGELEDVNSEVGEAFDSPHDDEDEEVASFTDMMAQLSLTFRLSNHGNGGFRATPPMIPDELSFTTPTRNDGEEGSATTTRFRLTPKILSFDSSEE